MPAARLEISREKKADLPVDQKRKKTVSSDSPQRRLKETGRDAESEIIENHSGRMPLLILRRQEDSPFVCGMF